MSELNFTCPATANLGWARCVTDAGVQIPVYVFTDQVNNFRFGIVFPDHDYPVQVAGNFEYRMDGYKTAAFRATVPHPGEAREADINGIPGNSTIPLEPSVVPFPWPPAKRPALGPLPPGVYDQTLWFDLPAEPSKRYMRGDWWGVVVPGLPYLPGFTSLEHPERCLTWFLPRWAPQWQDAILAAHAERGHTHFGLMWEDAQLAGLDINGFIALCKYVKQTIPYLQVSLGSKGLTPRDQNPDQYWARNGVVADALLNAGCVDEFIPGFEWNLWNVPGDWTIETFQRLGDLGHSADVTTGMHFSTGVTGWWSAGSNRFDFSRQMVGHIDVLNYQGDPVWDVPTYQARICDTLRDDPTYAAGLIDMRDFERDAAAEFSNDQPDEAATALRGYLMQCTRAPAHLWGYGNNGLRLDGSML